MEWDVLLPLLLPEARLTGREEGEAEKQEPPAAQTCFLRSSFT